MKPRWLFLLVPCILVAVTALTIGPWFEIVEAFKPAQPFEMKPIESEEVAVQMLGGLDETTRAEYRSAQFWDAPFALANILALLVLIMVPARLIWSRSRFIWILALVPIMVALGEAIENTGILSMLSSVHAPDEVDPSMAAFGTGLKFMGSMLAMLSVIALWLAAGTAALVRSRRKNVQASTA